MQKFLSIIFSRKVMIPILILFMLILASTNFIINYQWFSEVGYNQVFLKELITKLQIGIPLFLILTIIIYVYFSLLKALYNKKLSVLRSPQENKKENRWVLLGTAILSFLISIIINNNIWYLLLEFIHSTDFNISDPIFSNDMSFYVFKLPFIEQIYSTGLNVLILMALASFGFFVFMFSRNSLNQGAFQNNQPERPDLKQLLKDFVSLASRQLAIVVAAFLLFLALGFYINNFGLLYSPGRIIYGASYTDVNIRIWMNRILIIISIISALLTVYAGYKKKFKMAVIGPICIVAITLVGNIVSLGVENFIVSPNELSKETPYLENHIEYTQRAYGLDNMQERDFPVEQNLTAEDLSDNMGTINNIPINDYRPTLSMYNSIQGFRRYYEFNDIDKDRYMIDGEYTQVFLSARELNQEKMEENSKTWINQHLKYTHGFGAAVSPVNRVTESGQPELIVENIPPQGIEDLAITEPRIYFGEMTDQYAIVNAQTPEFDFPQGDSNAEYFYEGDAGIQLNLFNRILFAISEQSPRILLSNDVTSDSRILINRNIIDRIQTIAPFFIYDEDPYLVIDEGKLYWIMDAFTVTDRYAYSEPFGENGFNYIRNSVKVVVDAFNGDVTFYQVDKEDPIANTYEKIYPGLLTDIDEMPEGIRDNIRYSQEYFDIQSEVYGIYHMDNPAVFYNKEDVWEISTQIYGTDEETQRVESAYMIMDHPDGDGEEFVLMVPYTPRQRDNMVSWLAALNDGENYGELIIYRFPKQELIYGPMQIEKRIDQNTEISKELTLLDQQGSNVIRGNLLTIPIENSIIFVEPIYIQSAGESNNLPEVKRVIVAYENEIIMGNSLEEGLNAIFGLEEESRDEERQEEVEEESGVSPELIRDSQELIKDANELFNQAQDAQRQGDWGQYGDYIEELENTLEELQQSVGHEDVLIEEE